MTTSSWQCHSARSLRVSIRQWFSTWDMGHIAHSHQSTLRTTASLEQITTPRHRFRPKEKNHNSHLNLHIPKELRGDITWRKNDDRGHHDNTTTTTHQGSRNYRPFKLHKTFPPLHWFTHITDNIQYKEYNLICHSGLGIGNRARTRKAFLFWIMHTRYLLRK